MLQTHLILTSSRDCEHVFKPRKIYVRAACAKELMAWLQDESMYNFKCQTEVVHFFLLWSFWSVYTKVNKKTFWN